jgi:hypothetical protein
MNKYLLIILSLILFKTSIAQALITGQVKSSETNLGIAYVSVMLNGSNRGTATDENGFFSFEIPDYSSDNFFTFRILGYKTVEVNLVQLMKNDIIYLEIEEQEIAEMKVHPINPFLLLRSAIVKIPSNYYSTPIGQEIFYRQLLYTNEDLSVIEEGHYHLLNNFQQEKIPKRVTVKKSRAYHDYSAYENLGNLVTKNLISDSVNIAEVAEEILNFNPNLKTLTDSKDGVFSSTALKFYDFSYGGMSIKNNHVMYIIHFDQKEGVKKTLYKGSIFIDTASLAIVEFEAGLSPEGLDFQKVLPLKMRILAKIAGYSINIQEISIQAKYEVYNEFWVIDKGEFQLKGTIAKKKVAPIQGVLHLSYDVLNNYPKNQYYNLSSKYRVIPSNIEDFENSYFWGNLNVIPLPTKAAYILEQKLTKP